MSGMVGEAIKNVKKMSEEFEAQMDAAVAEGDDVHYDDSSNCKVEEATQSRPDETVSKCDDFNSTPSVDTTMDTPSSPSKTMSLSSRTPSSAARAKNGKRTRKASDHLVSDETVYKSQNEVQKGGNVFDKEPDILTEQEEEKKKDEMTKARAEAERQKEEAEVLRQQEEENARAEAERQEQEADALRQHEQKKQEEEAKARAEAERQEQEAEALRKQEEAKARAESERLKEEADAVRQQEEEKARAEAVRLNKEENANTGADSNSQRQEQLEKSLGGEMSSAQLLQEESDVVTGSDSVNSLRLQGTIDTLQQELVDLRHTHDVAIEELKRESNQTISRLEAENKELVSSLKYAEENVCVLQTEVSSLESKLRQKESEFESATVKLSEQMRLEIDNLTEVITQRERALQNANVQTAELNRQYEEASERMSSLSSELNDYKGRLKQMQSASAGEGELRKELARMQELINEKDISLAAFQKEGQALAKKQSDMEKNVRKSRQEVREKDGEIAKLKEQRDQYVKTIEEMQDVIRKNETNALNSQKQMSVVQAVNQASQEKLTKLEAEINSKVDELSTQRRALESAWADNNDLKRTIAELKAERDDLQSQIGAGASKANESESSRRDLEQREAILRATNKQLQDSLQRQMNEASAREERMREELNETRKRWQEAITSREALASEVGGATTPLLRQITTLQETLRLKSDAWQKVESALSERAMRAENAAECAENKKAFLEEETAALRQKVKTLTSKQSELEEQCRESNTIIDRLTLQNKESRDRIEKLQSSLDDVTSQRLSLESSVRDMEMRHKRAMDQVRDENDALSRSSQHEVAVLRTELESLRSQLNGRVSDTNDRIYDGRKESKSVRSPDVCSDSSRTSSDQKWHRYETGAKQVVLPGNESSFMASERAHQMILQKDEKIDDLTLQIQQIQKSRDALLEEVSFLSSKISEYEESLDSLPRITAELADLRGKNDALLVLLGEKEEELENTIQDMQDMKSLYRTEIEKLLCHYAPEQPVMDDFIEK